MGDMKKHVFVFVFLALFATKTYSQKVITAGVSNGDTLSRAFIIPEGQIPIAIIAPGTNASDTLKIKALDWSGGYRPVYYNNSEYYLAVKKNGISYVPLNQDIFKYIRGFKIDQNDAATDSVTYRLLTFKKE